MISEFNEWVNERVLENLHGYTRNGRELNLRCPICGDSKKNAMKKRGYYSMEKCSYYCHNCGASMSGQKFLSEISHISPDDIKKEFLKTKYNGKFRKSENFTSSNADKTHSVLFSYKSIIKPEWKNELSENAKNYLNGRKVLSAPYLKDRLYSFFDRQNREYILIPWTINGESAYFQLNDFEKHNKMGMKYIFPKNKDKLLFGLDNIDISIPFIIIVEGVYDSLFLPNCVCCGGKHLSELQYKILKSRFPRHQLVMGLDNDKPGLLAASKIIEEGKGRSEFKFFKWFTKSTKQKDINDYVLSTGDVNIFTDIDYVKSCFVDSVMMKMYLIENKLWKKKENDKGAQKPRKIQLRPLGNIPPVKPQEIPWS